MNAMRANAYSGALDGLSDTLRWATDREDRKGQREEESRRWNVQNDRAAAEHDLQMESGRRKLDNEKEIDDYRKFSAHVANLSDAFKRSNFDFGDGSGYTDEQAAARDSGDAYNIAVDKAWSDPEFQRILKDREWAKGVMGSLDQRVEAWNGIGQTAADIAANGKQNVTMEGNNQVIRGPQAQEMFKYAKLLRNANDEDFPATVIPDSIRLVSPAGTDKIALVFDYTDETGKRVTGTATQDKTAGADDPVRMHSLSDIFEQAKEGINSAMALKQLHAGALAGDTQAQTALRAADLKEIEKATAKKADASESKVVGGVLKKAMAAWNPALSNMANLAAIKIMLHEEGIPEKHVDSTIKTLTAIKEPKKGTYDIFHINDGNIRTEYWGDKQDPKTWVVKGKSPIHVKDGGERSAKKELEEEIKGVLIQFRNKRGFSKMPDTDRRKAAEITVLGARGEGILVDTPDHTSLYTVDQGNQMIAWLKNTPVGQDTVAAATAYKNPAHALAKAAEALKLKPHARVKFSIHSGLQTQSNALAEKEEYSADQLQSTLNAFPALRGN